MVKGDVVNLIKKSLRRFDLAFVRYDHRYHPLARRMRLLKNHGVDLVFDVGANNGGWAAGLRELGYQGRIVSFEPLSEAFRQLAERPAKDPNWDAVRTGFGDSVGSGVLHIAGNSESSSMLPMLPLHTAVLPSSKYVGSETVPLTTLDAAVQQYSQRGKRLFVKIDAQGCEPKILSGAGASVEQIVGLQVEMSLTPLYEGEMLLPEMVNFVAGMGYSLMSLEPGFSDQETGRLLQVDGLFFRNE